MDYSKYKQMKNAEIPAEIQEKINTPGRISQTAFEDKNNILLNTELQNEIGYTKMANGDYLVSVTLELTDVTAEMINWWFWWHAQDSERYKMWFPGEHFAVSYSRRNKAYFSRKSLPVFQENTHYPIEKIGKAPLPLSINFVSAEDFAFDKELMKKANVGTIICGHVGAVYDIVPHTEMAHIYFSTANGLRQVSRFWIGKRCKNPLIRKVILGDGIAKSMAEHCYKEYTNLARKLPDIYENFGEQTKKSPTIT